ncbi:MAG: MBL fold metallo-hydrolase [Firmicutes bacterium]|nr:MBL fold metallo-hydrolase [Bacillota bacterium]
MAVPSTVTPVDDGVYQMDLFERGLRGRSASYLVLGDRPALVEVGASVSVPSILASLAEIGIAQEEIAYVAITHVHLDHAGGAGTLMQELPNAVLLCHTRAARHMIDPSRLEASARQVYGDRFDRFWGRLQAVPKERVRVMEDNTTCDLGNGHILRFLDTPGHAKHHTCLLDEKTGGLFSGDTAGLRFVAPGVPLAEPLYMPTSSPVDFDPVVLEQTCERLLGFDPQRIYFTHFGVAEKAGSLLENQIAQVRHYREIGMRYASQGIKVVQDVLRQEVAEILQGRGVADPDSVLGLFALDLELNAGGIVAWWQKQQ